MSFSDTTNAVRNIKTIQLDSKIPKVTKDIVEGTFGGGTTVINLTSW